MTLASLTGCTKEHNFERNNIKYNNFHGKSMIIQKENEITDYYTPLRFPHPTSKDVLMLSVWTKDKRQIYSYPYDKQDSSIVKEKLQDFDKYINKIDSMERAK